MRPSRPPLHLCPQLSSDISEFLAASLFLPFASIRFFPPACEFDTPIFPLQMFLPRLQLLFGFPSGLVTLAFFLFPLPFPIPSEEEVFPEGGYKQSFITFFWTVYGYPLAIPFFAGAALACAFLLVSALIRQSCLPPRYVFLREPTWKPSLLNIPRDFFASLLPSLERAPCSLSSHEWTTHHPPRKNK